MNRAQDVRSTLTGNGGFGAVLKNYARIVTKNALLILLTTTLAAGAAVAYEYTRDVQYSSSATLRAPNTARVPTYLRLATTETVIQPALRAAGIELSVSQATAMIVAANPQRTSLVVITAHSTQRAIPQELVEAVADELVTEAARIESSLGTDVSDPLVIVDAASEAAPPGSRASIMNIALAGLLGLIVGLVIAFLRDLRGTPLRSVAEVVAMVRLPLVADLRNSRVTEDTVGKNLRFLSTESGSVFAISGVGRHVSSRVVIEAARRLMPGTTTVLVDFDLAGRTLTTAGRSAEPGASDVIIGAATAAEAVAPGVDGAASVLFAGTVPPNAVDLVTSQRATDLVEELTGGYERVTLVLPARFDDAYLAAGWASRAVWIGVVEIGATTRRELDAWEQIVTDRAAAIVTL